jgi:hypothetical protein
LILFETSVAAEVRQLRMLAKGSTRTPLNFVRQYSESVFL